MDLDGLFAGAEVGGDLLVQQAPDDHLKHLTLPRVQGLQVALDRVPLPLGELIARLPERESRIIQSRFGLSDGQEKTLEEIGAEFRLTRERIRQLQKAALTKLRRMLEESVTPQSDHGDEPSPNRFLNPAWAPGRLAGLAGCEIDPRRGIP